MKITLALTLPRNLLKGPAADLVALYERRSGRYLPCSHRIFTSEESLLRFVRDSTARTRPLLWLADSRGRQVSSEDLASEIGRAQDDGIQALILAIGPADGWSPAIRQAAALSIAFGRITLPHELAAAVAAEQIYRALTIRAGHPYHSGH